MSENMKKHFIALAFAVVLMIAIPLFTVQNRAWNDIKTNLSSNKEKYSETLTGILAKEFHEGYCEEGLKAVAIILNSNYKSGVKYKTMSKNAFMKKYEKGSDYYSLIEKTAEETADIIITYKGKTVKIPCSYITDGSCEIDYPYLRCTDNPWDLNNKSFTYECKSGVSLNSINELCKKGLSCEEALNRYFKNTSIKSGAAA